MVKGHCICSVLSNDLEKKISVFVCVDEGVLYSVPATHNFPIISK